MSKTSPIIFCSCLTLLLAACQVEPAIPFLSEKEHYRLKGYQNLKSKHQLELANKNEPGQRFLLCGKLVDRENKKAVKHQLLRFFQADDAGRYQTEPNNKNAPRLNGFVTTNDLGMFFIKTSLPGSNQGGQAIYMTEQNENPYLYEIHFLPLVSFFEKKGIEKNGQQFLADLKKRKDGVLIGFVVVERKK